MELKLTQSFVLLNLPVVQMSGSRSRGFVGQRELGYLSVASTQTTVSLVMQPQTIYSILRGSNA